MLIYSKYALRYKHYERWATASDFPVENIINDGSTTFENRFVFLLCNTGFFTLLILFAELELSQILILFFE